MHADRDVYEGERAADMAHWYRGPGLPEGRSFRHHPGEEPHEDSQVYVHR